MSTLLTINVTNNSSMTQSFYVFQQPALFSGGSQVYNDSLYAQSLGSYSITGAILTMQMNRQTYACIQQANTVPQVGQSSGYASASRAIELASGGGSPDATTASLQPLGLSAPQYDPGVQPGAFRISTPPYTPPAIYNAGSALQVNGGLVMSSFVMANPASNIDCQPILKFYIQTGSYSSGTVINFASSSTQAALCDFTGGQSTINVTYNADGTWSTQVVQ